MPKTALKNQGDKIPNKIFLLPSEGALIAERIDDDSSFVREPVTRARYVARLIEAVPDDWSDMSGLLDAADPDAAWDTGYEFHRHGSSVRIVARRRWTSHDKVAEVVRPDLFALLVEKRAPGFISFDDIGFNANWQFLAARSLAVGFIRQGYRGWLSINNGRDRKDADQKPAQVDLHMSPWSLLADVNAPRCIVPSAVVLSWDERHGGCLAQLEPIHAVCRRALREWTGDISHLGEAAC
jgi:hypothetical protein